MLAIISVFNLLMLVGVLSLIFLQTSRSIFIRSLGLIIIFLSIISYYVLAGNFNIPVLVISFLLTLLGILSDIYSATLRTWFFSISGSNMKTVFYTIFISILIMPMAFNLNVAHGIIIGTILGSILKDLQSPRYSKGLISMIKSSLGTIVGFYGMGTKLLLGIQMIDLFFRIR